MTGDPARLEPADARPSSSEPLTIEQVTGFDPPREYRLHPRDRGVACTSEAGGARQLFTLPLRGGSPTQLTASEHDVSDPQWSPDGRRLAFVRDGSIWVIDADGSRQIRVTEHPAGNRLPHWAPDGLRLAFVSRRRGWSQIWVIDAPVPRRGRPAHHPRPVEPRAVTPAGLDVEEFAWSPDGARIALTGEREAYGWRSAISVIDVASGVERMIGSAGAVESGPTWLPDGSLLLLSDASGWFQVIRLSPDLRERTLLTIDPNEHGEPGGGYGLTPLPSPDGARFVHIRVHDGLTDLVVAPLAAPTPVKRGRGRPPRNPPPVAGAGDGIEIQPWPGLWRAIGWTTDGGWVAAVGERERSPLDLWLLPVPGLAPAGARARRVTDSLPGVLRTARFVDAERIAFPARDGLRIEGNLFRPPSASGKRGGGRVPTVIHLHGGPTGQSFRGWNPLKQLLVRDGFAVLDVDVRGSTGYGRTFREANIGEWGRADARDVVDAGRWAAAQPWSNGRLAAYGASYGGYLTLCVLVEAPEMWQAGVDLFGDSEIAESFRHGDRTGRLDVFRMMGDPDDPARAEGYRLGSPVYRAERIQAPLLILHGRKDKRVVPLMTERMVEALTIEDKVHEVHWYDEAAHGWARRDDRRDSLTRIMAFLRLHLAGSPGATD